MKNSDNRDTRREMLAEAGAKSLTKAELEHGGRLDIKQEDRDAEEKRGSLTFKDDKRPSGGAMQIAMDPQSPGVLQVLATTTESKERRGSQRSSLGRERINSDYWIAEEAKLAAQAAKNKDKAKEYTGFFKNEPLLIQLFRVNRWSSSDVMFFKNIFQLFEDENELVAVDEFYSALQGLGIEATVQDVQDLLGFGEIDEHGEIDFVEFLWLLGQLHEKYSLEEEEPPILNIVKKMNWSNSQMITFHKAYRLDADPATHKLHFNKLTSVFDFLKVAYDEQSLQAAIEGTNIRELGELMRQQSLLEEEYARKRAAEDAEKMRKAMRRDSGSSVGEGAGAGGITMLALDKRKEEEVPDLLAGGFAMDFVEFLNIIENLGLSVKMAGAMGKTGYE